MVMQGSSLFDSRSYCEPVQLAWESISGVPFVARPVDAHLLRRVLKPSGVGKLEPALFPLAAAGAGGHLVRKALNENPVAQIAVLGVLAVVVGFLLLTRMAGNSGGGDPSASSPTASDASTAPALADSAGTPAVPSPARPAPLRRPPARPRPRRP